MLRPPQKQSSRLVPVLLVAAAFCAFGLATAAEAQNALGDGRALDRNPRIGSNGRNPSAPDLSAVARFNNAVVTGNAGYGKSFRGYVGYFAPNDFRSSLGSNDLFAFKRDSSSGAAVSEGIRGTDALRYQFQLSTGSPPSSFGRGPNASGASLVTARAGATPGGFGSPLRSTSDYLGVQSLRPDIIGYRKTERGVDMAVTASPLLGVTATPLRAVQQPFVTATPENAAVPGVVPTAPTVPGVTPNRPINPSGEPNQGSNGEAKPARSTLTGFEATRPGLPSPMSFQNAQDRGADASPLKFDTRVEAPSAVLSSIRNSLPPEKTAVPNTPDGAAPSKPAWEKELDRLRDRLREEREEKEMRQRPQSGDSKPESSGDGDENKEDPKDAAPDRKGRPMTMDEVRELVKPDLEKLDRDVARAIASARPLIDRLAPDSPTNLTNYDRHMKSAEALLIDARYFDAEAAFVQALAAKPGDPLASVGRVHAQLGAGLYLSAAMNLHDLFAEHPEMIGVRYDRALLPGDERAGIIASGMRTNIHATRTLLGRDAALLLAYLGYQRDDRAMLEEGVSAFAERAENTDKPERTLLAMMQRVWIDGGEAPEMTPADRTPPDKTPAQKPVEK